MIRAHHARLYELLTGEPADPEAALKAAIAEAALKHAKRVHHYQDLRTVKEAALGAGQR